MALKDCYQLSCINCISCMCFKYFKDDQELKDLCEDYREEKYFDLVDEGE